ncbi:MAG: hypothetical protein Kow00107_00610 [Planctomycetota bacterium]
MLAELVQVAPNNFKINNYVAQCYLAYGYPEMAFDYIKSNPQVFSDRYFMNAWSSLMSIATDYGDDKTMDSVLEQIVKVYEKDGLTPPELASIHGFQSRVIGYLNSQKRYEEAVKRADENLKWFDGKAKELENSPFFTSNAANNPEIKDYYYGVYFLTVKLSTFMYRQQALAYLKRDLDKLYEPFEKMLKDAEQLKFGEKSSYRAQPYYVKYRVLYTISTVARAAGDNEKSTEYSKLGKEAYDRYRSEIDKMKKEQEAAKKAQEEAKE